jgi:hypothetical protein
VISVSGVDETIARLLGIAAKAEVARIEGERKAAEPVLRAAQDGVAVDTGALKGTLRIEEREGHAAVVAGDDNVDYAAKVEFAPDNEPFLRPAADDATGDAVHEIENAIGDVIR